METVQHALDSASSPRQTGPLLAMKYPISQQLWIEASIPIFSIRVIVLGADVHLNNHQHNSTSAFRDSDDGLSSRHTALLFHSRYAVSLCISHCATYARSPLHVLMPHASTTFAVGCSQSLATVPRMLCNLSCAVTQALLLNYMTISGSKADQIGQVLDDDQVVIGEGRAVADLSE